MAANGQVDSDMEVSPAIFQDLSNLEKQFADVELDALRKKEFNLAPLYTRRTEIVNQLPSFWPQALLNGPQEFQSVLSHEIDDETEETADGIAGGNLDIATISAIKNFTVERYQIQSETQGEPRSLRFTFEFNKNAVFEDEKVVKDFEYVSHPDGESGGLISKPVTFKWTKKGKKLIQQKTGGLLDLAVELYQAEEATKFNVKDRDGKKGAEVDVVDREGLWQYEKLREKLEKLEDADMEGEGAEGCWLDWFGYRGPVDIGKEKTDEQKEKAKARRENARQKKVPQGDGVEDEDEFEGFDDDDEEDEDDLFSGVLDVEIFPAGDDIAIALADDLWPNVMDYFMKAQDPMDDDDDDDELDIDEDDEDVPELVEAEELDVEDQDAASRPNKKQRTI